MLLRTNWGLSTFILLVIVTALSSCGPTPLNPDSPSLAHLGLITDFTDPDFDTPALPDDPDSENDETHYSQPVISYNFEEPDYNYEEAKAILKKYAHIDKENLVPDLLLNKTLLYYHQNLKEIPNKSRITVIDVARHSKFKRMWIINMQTGAVWAMHVAHGKGSDENHDGIAEKFSNQQGSNATSLGFYLTGDRYYGKWGLSMFLDGLSVTNSKARERAIVLHGAPYVKNAPVRQGRSWGCPAVAMENRNRVVEILAGGSLMFIGLSK